MEALGESGQAKKPKRVLRSFRLVGLKELAATYSRGSYTTTTIGKTVFDGRVRNGNGSGHSFMATKNLEMIKELGESSLKSAHRRQGWDYYMFASLKSLPRSC